MPQYLTDSGQEEKAAELKERQGEYVTAINLYIKGGMPAKVREGGEVKREESRGEEAGSG